MIKGKKISELVELTELTGNEFIPIQVGVLNMKIKSDLLKGQKGDKGDTGNTGALGIPGPQGEPGKDGKNGKDGKDGITPDISNLATKDDLNNKQDKLVSGTNIATINNQDITKGGNITISGGGSGGTTNYNELTNKPKIDGVELSGDKTADELGLQNKGDYALKSEIPSTANLATKDELKEKADKVKVIDNGASNTTLEIKPNTLYKWGEVAELTITLAAPTDANIINEYMFQFTSGTQATKLTIPQEIKWIGGTPKIEASKTYQVSIVNNIAIMGGV